jgi:hypothetical protein
VKEYALARRHRAGGCYHRFCSERVPSHQTIEFAGAKFSEIAVTGVRQLS